MISIYFLLLFNNKLLSSFINKYIKGASIVVENPQQQ